MDDVTSYLLLDDKIYKMTKSIDQKKIQKNQVTASTKKNPKSRSHYSTPTSTSNIQLTIVKNRNEELQQQLLNMKYTVQMLMQQKNQDTNTIITLRQKKPKSNKRKSRKPTCHFDYIAKNIAKKILFPMIKFVSTQDLNNYTHHRSIGYQFLKALKNEDQVKDSTLFDDNDELLWLNAKDIVKDGLSEKRNSRQTQTKKAWKGLL